ncbi:MAG: hypothetical protein JOZ43_00140 [Acidobacteriales bacterium]|nr:hypothetical protein [Terriglobales bacterium]
MRSASGRAARVVLIACAIGASLYSLLLARAEWLFRQDTPASVAAAVKLVPYNGSYVARLAAWRPAEKTSLLLRAVDLNPFDYQSWIQLGFGAEFEQHDIAAAERDFLKAADVNHMYLPKWTLTNFYFRHSREPEFFQWARATLAITPYPPEPVFVQMWQMSQQPDKIAASIPDRPRILLPYAWFLSNHQQASSIPAVVDRLVRATHSKDGRSWGRDDVLAGIEDRLLASGDTLPALEIWRTLAQSDWIRTTVPDPSRPLTNGGFRAPFFPHGFDWRPINQPGVTLDQLPNEGVIRLHLSGDQPENCILLQQYLPLTPADSYRLTWNATADPAVPSSGLAWYLRSVSSGTTTELVSGDLLQVTQSWHFRSPPGSDLGLLSLQYSRPLGEVRFSGNVSLSSVLMTRDESRTP